MSVDLGNNEIPLHSEASFSPSWPEIIWFYCSSPSKKSGFTTVVDGVKVYENLKISTKKFFLENQTFVYMYLQTLFHIHLQIKYHHKII